MPKPTCGNCIWWQPGPSVRHKGLCRLVTRAYIPSSHPDGGTVSIFGEWFPHEERSEPRHRLSVCDHHETNLFSDAVYCLLKLLLRFRPEESLVLPRTPLILSQVKAVGLLEESEVAPCNGEQP